MSWLNCPHASKLCNGTYYSLHGSCNYAPTLSVVYCYSPQQMQHNQCSTTNAATMQYYAILHQVSQAERTEDFLRRRSWRSAPTNSMRQVHTFWQKTGRDSMQHNQSSNHSVLCHLARVSSRKDARFLACIGTLRQSASTSSTKQVHTFWQKAGCDFNRKHPRTNAADLDTDIALLHCQFHCFCII